MPSRRTLIASGAGAVALAALGYRAWDRGAFAGATGPAYDPWDEWPGTAGDGARRPVRSAILAASPHNTQPWRFALSDTGITIFADRARHLGTFDPFRREMHLGLGCAIENLVCAARSFGVTTDVRPTSGRLMVMPRPEPIPAAQIEVGAGHPSPDPLFDAIPQRHTHRGPYRDARIAPDLLHRLGELVSGPNLRVVFVDHAAALHEMAELIVEATRQIISDPEMSMDSFRWIRTGRREILEHRDGVTLDTSSGNELITIAGKMLPDFNAAKTDRFWLSATRDVHTATAPVFGMILVPDRLDMAQALAAGRAWQRLQLSATAQGLSAQPLNQPVEMIDRNQMLERRDEFGPALARWAGANGWEPTFVFRLGYAKSEAPRSPRRPLEDVATAET